MLTGNIIADNPTGDCLNMNAVTGSYNLIKDTNAACGLSDGVDGNIVGFDPQLAGLTNNGGQTETHALQTGSPAVNAGKNGNCPAADQRDVTRPQNTTCDIGAYELWRLDTGMVSPTELNLTWANAAAGCIYDVYEETMPYFTPTTVTYPNQSSGAIYPRLGDVTPNYFYVVKAVCGGLATAVSNKVGEFDFAIVPGD